MPNEDDLTINSPSYSDQGKTLLAPASALLTFVVLALLAGALAADEARCPFGCLKVVDAERSRPVEEYAVSIVDGSDPFPDFFALPPGFPQPPRGTVVRTDIVRSSDGIHQLPSPVEPRLRIDVFGAGYLMSSVAAPGPGETFVVRLSKAFALSGRVENRHGRPVAGAEVRLHRSDGLTEPRRPPVAVTDVQGHFEIAPLYERDLLLEISHSEFQTLRTRPDLRQPPERRTFLLRGLDENPPIGSAQPAPLTPSSSLSGEEAPTHLEVEPKPVETPRVYAASLPVAAPESTLPDLDRIVLREVLHDVRGRVQDVIDAWDDPPQWELMVLARTEPFDWMEKMAWAIREQPFDAEPLLPDHDVERSGEPVVIGRLIREVGLEPVALDELPLESHGSSFPIAIDFVDHSRHGKELGRLPVLVSTTLPAMNDAGTEAIVFVRSSVFDFFQWIYHVEIQDGRPRITWVAEPVPSC